MSGIPSYIIIIWSGSTLDIPNGWLLCDGQNNTPDLTDRFVVTTGSSYALSSTGGSADATLISHTHTGSTTTDGEHTHTAGYLLGGGSGGFRGIGGWPHNGGNWGVSGSGNHSHTLTIDAAGAGENGVDKNLPPYYAFAYIMKEEE